MKYLVVGLGNIGAEYADTRHNIGFKVLDALAAASDTSFISARYGAVAELRHRGHQVTLLKPATYMNLSGKAVRYWIQELKVDLRNVLVVVDDIALPFGELRLRGRGSAGGHNGLKNITELLGTEDYARMRFGIGGDFARGHQVDYVLVHLPTVTTPLQEPYSYRYMANRPKLLRSAAAGILAAGAPAKNFCEITLPGNITNINGYRLYKFVSNEDLRKAAGLTDQALEAYYLGNRKLARQLIRRAVKLAPGLNDSYKAYILICRKLPKSAELPKPAKAVQR